VSERGKQKLARLARGFVFLLANPEVYSDLASWRVVIRTLDFSISVVELDDRADFDHLSGMSPVRLGYASLSGSSSASGGEVGCAAESLAAGRELAALVVCSLGSLVASDAMELDEQTVNTYRVESVSSDTFITIPIPSRSRQNLLALKRAQCVYFHWLAGRFHCTVRTERSHSDQASLRDLTTG
jgi:hypothetical protein